MPALGIWNFCFDFHIWEKYSFWFKKEHFTQVGETIDFPKSYDGIMATFLEEHNFVVLNLKSSIKINCRCLKKIKKEKLTI